MCHGNVANHPFLYPIATNEADVQILHQRVDAAFVLVASKDVAYIVEVDCGKEEKCLVRRQGK